MVETINEPVLRKTWPVVAGHLSIHDKHDHAQAVIVLNRLLDEVGDNEKNPLHSFLEILGIVIENYEAEHCKWGEASGVDVLKFLMQEHKLNQGDLFEIGSQGVVSEILNGKRQLNVNQIKKLGNRFHVSPAVFL